MPKSEKEAALLMERIAKILEDEGAEAMVLSVMFKQKHPDGTHLAGIGVKGLARDCAILIDGALQKLDLWRDEDQTKH